MKQILTTLILIFLFFGCTPKQTIEIKPPQDKDQIGEILQKPEPEDTITIFEKFEPLDIEETIPEEKIERPPLIENVTLNDLKIDNERVNIKVAFIYPSTLVSKYAKSSLNTISGYFSYQKENYDLTVIDSINENHENIYKAFDKVAQEGITNVIALFTPNVITVLDNIAFNDMKVYLPLIEKKDSLTNNENLIFGSISYEQQIQKLSDYSIGTNTMFYQDSYIGNKLRRAYDLSYMDTSVIKEISSTENNFRNIVRDYKLRNSLLYLNTDVVKSSLILSQLRAYDIYPKAILSTQINYDPMIMLLTQDKDRHRLIVANSIDRVNDELKDEIMTFGADIMYEWVDYSTLVGINYLYYGDNSSLIETKIFDNQVVYNPKLYKSTSAGFLEIK